MSENNPFSMAVKAGLAKKVSLKDYLMKVEELTEEQADLKIEEMNE